MNKQAFSSPELLRLILNGQTFYHTGQSTPNVRDVSPAEFDVWASSLVEEIAHVKRDTWDMFARWKFLLAMQEQGILWAERDAQGCVTFHETEVPAEEKTSAAHVSAEEKTSAGGLAS